MSEGPITLPEGAPPLDLSAFIDGTNTGDAIPQGVPAREDPRDAPFTEELSQEDKLNAPYKRNEFVKPIEDMYNMASFAVDMLDRKEHYGDTCSEIITASSHDIAVKWDELARTNPAVRRALRKMTTGSAVGGIFIAHIPIALALMTNHVPTDKLPGPLGMLATAQAEQQEAVKEAEAVQAMNAPKPAPRKRAAARKRTPPKAPDTAANVRRSQV